MINRDAYISSLTVSHGDRMSSAADVARCITGIADACGFQLVGYKDRRERATDLPPDGIEAMLPVKLARVVPFVFAAEHAAELEVRWIPPADPLLELGPVNRTMIWTRVDSSLGRDAGEKMMLSAVEWADAFYAELNDKRVTQLPVAPVYGCPHSEAVPHLAMANYFGEEYIKFFGGLKRIRAAGFAEVRPFHRGVYVQLGADADFASYVKKRTEVEARLGPAGLFGGERDGLGAPRFRIGD